MQLYLSIFHIKRGDRKTAFRWLLESCVSWTPFFYPRVLHCNIVIPIGNCDEVHTNNLTHSSQRRGLCIFYDRRQQGLNHIFLHEAKTIISYLFTFEVFALNWRQCSSISPINAQSVQFASFVYIKYINISMGKNCRLDFI